MGLVQPLGAILPLAETQAIWLAKLIRGECRLPDRVTMLRSINDEAAKNRQRYKLSARHTLQVDFYPYQQSLEGEMKTMRV